MQGRMALGPESYVAPSPAQDAALRRSGGLGVPHSRIFLYETKARERRKRFKLNTTHVYHNQRLRLAAHAQLLAEIVHPACECMSKVWTVACDATEVPAPLLQALQRTGLAFTPRPAMDRNVIKSIVVMRYDDERDEGHLNAIEARDVIEHTLRNDIRPDQHTEPTRADLLWDTAINDKATQRFLETHLVLETDKKMGACIVTREWYDTMQRQFIRDEASFPRLGRLERDTGEWQVWIPPGDPRGIPTTTKSTREGICNELIVQYKRYVYYLYESTYHGSKSADSIWTFIAPRLHEREFGELRLMPKVRKVPCKTRPVANQRDVLTARASKAVDKLLRALIRTVAEHPILGQYVDVIDANIPRNSERLRKARDTLVSQGFRAETLQFISADFEAMYTNICVSNAIEAIATLAARLDMDAEDTLTATIESTTPGESDPFTGRTLPGNKRRETITVQITELKLLTQAVMRYSPFVVNTWDSTELILQKEGVAMGVNLAPSLADVVALEAKLQLVDMQLLQDAHGPDSIEIQLRCAALHVPHPTPFTNVSELKHTLRQIDDVALLATPTFLAGRNLPGKEWITLFYRGPALGLNLVWTEPETDGWTPWLDTRQRVNPTTGQIEQRMYSKPGNTFTYPHGESYVPPGQRKGILIGGLKRIQSICAPADIPAETTAFLARLLHLQYSAREMRKWISQTINRQEATDRNRKDPDTGLANALQQLTLREGGRYRGTIQQRRTIVTWNPNIPTVETQAALRQRDDEAGGIAWRAQPQIIQRLPYQRAPPGAKRRRKVRGRLYAEAVERGLVPDKHSDQ